MKTAGSIRLLGVLIALVGPAAPCARGGPCVDAFLPPWRTSLARADPVDAVKLRQRGLRSALLAGDLSRILAFYAGTYHHRDGTTRRDLRSILARYFRDYTLVRIEPLSERYTVASSGAQVKQTLRVRFTQRDKETGQQETLEAVAVVEWSWHGGAWLITREQDGEAASASGLPSSEDGSDIPTRTAQCDRSPATGRIVYENHFLTEDHA